MKPIIVLQSDFSETWSAVSSMKGIIKSVDRDIDIEDGTHEIDPFNIWMAAQELRDLVNAWPDSTVFVSVVDPGVGTDRRASAARLENGSFIITPDNGTLSLVRDRIVEIREIDQTVNRSRHNERTEVFEGRDVFAYTAARLTAGLIDFDGVGETYPLNEIVLCSETLAEPVIREGYAAGFVSHVLPWYGGIRVNITNRQFIEKACFHIGDLIHVTIMHEEKIIFDQIVTFVRSFGNVRKGMPLIYEGSSLLISMDLNQANLAQTYGIHAGLEWKICFEIERSQSKK